MIRFNYNNIEINALNIPYTNHTLIIAPHYMGMELSFIFNGQIANQINDNEDLKRVIYTRIKNEYKFNRILTA